MIEQPVQFKEPSAWGKLNLKLKICIAWLVMCYLILLITAPMGVIIFTLAAGAIISVINLIEHFGNS